VRICVDTTILLDILKDEFVDFQEKLYSALRTGETLAAPVVVYAELIPQFRGDTGLLGQFLKDHRVEVSPLDIEAVTLAAQAWVTYLKKKDRARCSNCGHELNERGHFLSDFYIGGFALAKCDAILTRDRGVYTAYFPDLVGYAGCLDR
jgi:predicted nucleic acid-binding protein